MTDLRNKYTCVYSVIYLNEDGVNEKANGITFADSFADAAHQLETEIFGDDLISIINIELYDVCPIFSDETINLIRKELNEL